MFGRILSYLSIFGPIHAVATFMSCRRKEVREYATEPWIGAADRNKTGNLK